NVFIDQLGRSAGTDKNGHPVSAVDSKSPGTKQAWERLLANGFSRLQFITLIVNGQETFENSVTKEYQTLLGRTPEQSGLDFWVGVERDQGQDAVVAGIASSAEYGLKADKTSNTPLPQLSSLTPQQGVVGDPVTITGKFLSGASVAFNGVTASTI